MAQRIINHLKGERLLRGWSQSRVATLAGISRQAYSAIEGGDAVPSTEIALRLARILGRRVEALFALGEEGPGFVSAEWAGNGGPEALEGRRVRLARMGSRVLAFEAREGDGRTGVADGRISRGDAGRVHVELLPDRPPEPALVAVGCDPAFAIVAESLKRERGVEVFWRQLGSRASLAALARGEAHLAGVHLRDPLSGEYNRPWVERLVPFPCTRLTFAVWEQGILLGAGNPLNVERLEDLARPELRFVNREAGSGTRAFLDDRLSRAGIPVDAVPGYGTGIRGHMAVAEVIAAGLADAGAGIRAAASAYGLEMLGLGHERYELMIPDHLLSLPAVGALMEVLRRPGIRAQVEALGGYDAARMGEPL